MEIKKFSYIIYPAVIAGCLAWAVTGWLSMKTSTGISMPESAVSSKRTSKERTPDTSEILGKNIFKADMGSAVLQTAEKAAETHAKAPSPTASGFNGKLLGVVFGAGESYAIITYDEKKYILKEDEEKDGMTLIDVGYYHAVITRNGRDYRLVLTPDSEAGKTTAGQPGGSIHSSPADTGNVSKFKIQRKEVVEKLSDVNKVIKSVLIIPHEVNNEFVGYRIRRMTNTSVFRSIGVERNDVIMRLNGKTLNSPTVFFDALKNAETMTSVTLDILRNNKKMTIYVEIEG